MAEAPVKYDPLVHCMTCKREWVVGEGTLELTYGDVKTVRRHCPECMVQRLDGLPFTEPNQSGS